MASFVFNVSFNVPLPIERETFFQLEETQKEAKPLWHIPVITFPELKVRNAKYGLKIFSSMTLKKKKNNETREKIINICFGLESIKISCKDRKQSFENNFFQLNFCYSSFVSLYTQVKKK